MDCSMSSSRTSWILSLETSEMRSCKREEAIVEEMEEEMEEVDDGSGEVEGLEREINVGLEEEVDIIGAGAGAGAGAECLEGAGAGEGEGEGAGAGAEEEEEAEATEANRPREEGKIGAGGIGGLDKPNEKLRPSSRFNGA